MNVEIQTANDIVQIEAEQDDRLLSILNEETQPTPPHENLPPQAYCPICQCDTLQVIEIAEGDAGRGVFKYVCLDCGTEFYLLEDKVACAFRNINNSVDEIENLTKKINYHSEKIKGVENEY